MKRLGENQKFSAEELEQVRQLNDFDLPMFLSELHDFGAPAAKRLLPLIVQSKKKK